MNVKLRIWIFRVCLWGWWWHRRWVWNDLYMDEWRVFYEDGMTPKDQYIEAWCRE